MIFSTPPIQKHKQMLSQSPLISSADTELIGLVFELSSSSNKYLYPQYTTGLHAWFLNQVRQTNPDLSTYLHDSQSEKPFTISRLEGFPPSNSNLKIIAGQTYYWTITAFSKPLVQWLMCWVQHLPSVIELRNTTLQIRSCEIALLQTTYKNLKIVENQSSSVKLSFISPTSFRRKGHHFPLPVPTNLFHSYLRRWNDFSGVSFEPEKFLEWVDECVIIYRHRIESIKVPAGKKGMVTGFIGAIELGLSEKAAKEPEFEQLFYTLLRLAPYCGTGHKTTFGLGQTRLGWFVGENAAPPQMQI